MNRDPSSRLPQPRPAADPTALDGEVFPPGIRLIGSERAGTASGKASGAATRPRLGTVLLAGALVAVTVGGLGGLEAARWLHGRQASSASNATVAALAQLGTEVTELRSAVISARQDDASKVLKRSVDQLRADLDSLRDSDAAALARLSRLDVKPADATGPALADAVTRLDRVEHDPRLSEIASRLDRIEHQVSASVATGSIVPQPRAASGLSVVAQAPTVQSGRPGKPMVLDNWIVRDVYSGIALVEARSGSVREVVPGETLPGAGEVRSIQRHGRGWVVLTSRGVIDTETW